MPHRPEDTSTERQQVERQGEESNPSIEGSHQGGPLVTGDTQPPAPANRSKPGDVPAHGTRR